MRSRLPLNLIDLGSTCLLFQLRLEEALHRLATGNYVVLNRAPPAESTIVLGTSGVVSDLVHEDNAARDRVRIIRRFTGGGTVFIDHNAIMVSFIMGGGLFKPSPCPRTIMDWSSDIYMAIFRLCSSSNFNLIENDYCFGDKKFGGNAQTISGQRWVHHSSLLWNVNRPAMGSYLRTPKRQPNYRQRRDHDEFLCGMKDHIDGDQVTFVQAFRHVLKERFNVVETPVHSIADIVHEDHRRATSVISLSPTPLSSTVSVDHDQHRHRLNFMHK